MTRKRIQQIRHALYELERPLLQAHPPSPEWWSAWRLLVKFFGKHEVDKCSLCVSQKTT